jgi:hypothetical protein
VTEIQEEIAELLNKQEELLPALKEYLRDVKGVGPCIQHPLYYAVPHFPQMNAMVNRQFKEKERMLKKYLREENWSGVLVAHERPYRVQAFVGIEENLDDKNYWELLSWLWSDSENIWQNNSLWQRLLASPRHESHYFMDDDERKFFASLPDEITVYRGYQKGKNFDGISYTLNKERAEWFAKRWSRGNRAAVRERVVKKPQVFAYLAGRNEEEILLVRR